MNRPKTTVQPPPPFVVQRKAAFRAPSPIGHPAPSDQGRLIPQAPPVFRAGAKAKAMQAKALAVPPKQKLIATPPPFKPRLVRPGLPVMAARPVVVQRAGICSAIADAFRSCLGGVGAGANAYGRVEIQETDDIVSLLPSWGNAVSLGYHCTANWDEIRRTGFFRTGSGQLGDGVYIVKKDWAWVQSMYRTLNVVLEVGYIGDTRPWADHTLTIKSVPEYKRILDADGNYDVVKTENDTGTLNQICYKLTGPSGINLNNFRVRRVG